MTLGLAAAVAAMGSARHEGMIIREVRPEHDPPDDSPFTKRNRAKDWEQNRYPRPRRK